MRILVISTLSDLKEGLLPALRGAGHDLVAVVPSIKMARARRDLAGFALFEGESSCPGDWQRLIEGAEVVLHMAYSTAGAAECDFEPRHVLRADSVFQTVEAIADRSLTDDDDHRIGKVLETCRSIGCFGDQGTSHAHHSITRGQWGRSSVHR